MKKSEYKNSKKSLKLCKFVSISSILGVSTLVGCAMPISSSQIYLSHNSYVSSEKKSTSSSESKSSVSSAPEEMTLETWKKEFAAYFANVSDNFTLNENQTTYYVDGTKIAVEKKGQSRMTYYDKDENGVDFMVAYDREISGYAKSFADTLPNVDLSYLKNTTWNEYDKGNGLCMGEVNGEAVVACFENGNFLWTTNGKDYNLTGINTTSVQIPEWKLDNTKEEPIYTKDANGNFNFNCALIAEVCERWVKGENYWGKNLVSYLCRSDEWKDVQFLFFEPEIENGVMKTFRFMEVVTTEDGLSISHIKAIDKEFLRKFNNDELTTQSELLAALKAINVKNNVVDQYAISERFVDYFSETATAEEKYEFDTLMTRGMNKVSTVGVQKGSFLETDPSTVIDEYKDAEVLLGCVLKSKSGAIGYKLGDIHSFVIYAVIKTQNTLEWVNVVLAGSDILGEDNAFKNIEKDTIYWVVAGCDRTQIDINNYQIYENK